MDPATTSPLIDYKALLNNGSTSYVDSEGKTHYLDHYDPEKGMNLTPMNLSNPAPITGAATPTSLEDLVQSLFKSMAPSSAPAGKPLNYNLPGAFTDMSKASPALGDQYFQDYMGKIGAPSSVDAVQKGLDTQGVQQLMAEIDRMTRGSLASTKLDALDKGVGGVGGMGDVEANALAQVRTGGERNKSAAMLQAYQAELTRQKAREDAVNSAYGKRYEVGAASDTQGRSLMADLLGKEYAGGVTQSEGALNRASTQGMNYMNQILDYALKKGSLSQEDAQFYAKLISGENQGAADRQAAYDRAILAGRKPDASLMENLVAGSKIVGNLTGGAKDLWGGESPVLW